LGRGPAAGRHHHQSVTLEESQNSGLTEARAIIRQQEQLTTRLSVPNFLLLDTPGNTNDPKSQEPIIKLMDNLSELPNKLDKKNRQCRAIIETPKGSRNKFDFDPESKLFTLGGLLPKGLMFPYDFGFIPSTLGDDGDPVDIMIIMDEPAHVGCMLDVRLIGVIEADQTEGGKKTVNNRLIGIALHSYTHQHIDSVQDIDKATLNEVEEFFISYNKSRGKRFSVKAVGGPKRAIELLEQGIRKFKKEHGE
jgi:inorganic pyrophosphatase